MISDVATAYFNLLELDMELSIAKNTLATREESLRVIRIQHQAGAATVLDLRQAEQLAYGAAESIFQYQRIREIRGQRELLVTALQDRKRLAYIRYRGGVDTMVNALNADQDLFVAELRLAQARRDELLSVV